MRESEKRYRTLFDVVPIAVYTCDQDGVILEYNQRAVELWGWKPGKNGSTPKFCGSYKIYHPDGRPMPHAKCPMARALKGEELEAKDLEIVVERPNGERRNVIPAPEILRNDAGKIIGAINCLYDITEDRRSELAALRLAAIVNSSHDAIAAKDLNGIITDWNASAERIFGYKKQEIIGKSVLILIPQERRSEEQDILNRVRRGETLDHYETIRRRKDGTLIDVSLTISPIKDHDGKIVGVSKIARDITSRTQAEQRLAEQARLLDLTSDAIIIHDSDERILYWNKGAEEMYGYSRAEAIGKITKELLRTEFPKPLPSILKALGRERRWHGELLHYRKDGKQLTVLSRWVLDVDPTDAQEKILETNTDITEQTQAQQALAEVARQQAVLYQFVQRRSDAQSLSAIYYAGVDAIADLLRCNRAALLLFDDAQVMRFVAWRGLSERYRRNVERYLPWQANGASSEPICTTDVDLANLSRNLKAALKAEGIRALGFIPLVARRKLIGGFEVYYDKPHLFTGKERVLAITVGRQLAHGIDRKRSGEALHESEQRMGAMIEQATVGIARTDRKGRLLFVNKPFCQMLGYNESELIGQSIRLFTYKYEIARTARLFGRLVREGKPYELEKRYVRKDGSVIWVNVSASPVRDMKGKVQSAVAVVVDISARKKAESELLRSKEMLEVLVQRRTQALRAANSELKSEIERRQGLEDEILAVSDREQQRLGRELHDGLCQELTAVSLMAQSAALRLKQHRVVQVDDLEKIAALIKNSVIDARNIARDLHKEEMNAADFVRALHDLAERKIWSAPCRLKIATQFEIESDTVASELYRILREALVNVTKHARATEMSLEVTRKRNELIFSVTDNGVGLGAKVKSGSGLGFHIMNYRAKSIGGRLEVESLKTGGTRVSVHLPNGAHSSVEPPSLSK